MDIKKHAKDLIDRLPMERMSIKHETETDVVCTGYDMVRSVWTITLFGPLVKQDTRLDHEA